MSITQTAARTAVRAANTAGRQVTVTVDNDTTATDKRPHSLTGTARWVEPTNPNCQTLLLLGVTTTPGATPVTFSLNLQEIATLATADTAADITLGTRLDDYGNRVPNDAWTNGTGLE